MVPLYNSMEPSRNSLGKLIPMLELVVFSLDSFMVSSKMGETRSPGNLSSTSTESLGTCDRSLESWHQEKTCPKVVPQPACFGAWSRNGIKCIPLILKCKPISQALSPHIWWMPNEERSGWKCRMDSLGEVLDSLFSVCLVFLSNERLKCLSCGLAQILRHRFGGGL